MEGILQEIHGSNLQDIKLDIFEGPFDLLLTLLERNKLDIADISVSLIADQYMEVLHHNFDMEIASEFISMASHLMLIKTKMLLSAAEAAEAQSELDELKKGLVERQRKEAIEQIRLAMTVLEPRNEIGRCIFTKDPEPLKKDKTYRCLYCEAKAERFLLDHKSIISKPSEALSAGDELALKSALCDYSSLEERGRRWYNTKDTI